MTSDAESLLLQAFAALAPEVREPRDDAEVQRLVARARGGDRGAAGTLYQLHVHRVFRAVRPLCRDEAEAEDVVQECFVRALADLGRYRPVPGARFVSWLMTIAANVARRRMRWLRRVTLEREHRVEESSDADSLDEHLDRARRRTALLEALAELPAREREVVSLRYGAELGAAEVAEALGVSEANVRKICERQRRKLLEALETRLGSHRDPESGRSE